MTVSSSVANRLPYCQLPTEPVNLTAPRRSVGSLTSVGATVTLSGMSPKWGAPPIRRVLSSVSGPEGPRENPPVRSVALKMSWPSRKNARFFREESLEGGQVDDYVVRFDIAEIGIDRGRQQRIGGRAPEDLGAGLILSLMLDAIVNGGSKGVKSELPARFDVAQFVLFESGQVLVYRSRQSGVGPGFAAEMSHLALEIDTDLPVIAGLGQRHHGPWNEILDTPAVLQRLGGAVPGTVPLHVHLPLGQQGGVGHGIAQIHAQEIAVQAFAGGIEAHHEAVPIEPDIARGHARHQGVRGLEVDRRNVNAAFGIKHAHMGLKRGFGKGVGIDHAHAVNHGNPVPDRLVNEAVQADIGCAFFDAGQLRYLRHGSAPGNREQQGRD